MIDPPEPPSSIKGNLRQLALVQNHRIREINRMAAKLATPPVLVPVSLGPVPEGVKPNEWLSWQTKLNALNLVEARTAGMEGSPVAGLTPPVPSLDSVQLRQLIQSISEKIGRLYGVLGTFEGAE